MPTLEGSRARFDEPNNTTRRILSVAVAGGGGVVSWRVWAEVQVLHQKREGNRGSAVIGGSAIAEVKVAPFTVALCNDVNGQSREGWRRAASAAMMYILI